MFLLSFHSSANQTQRLSSGALEPTNGTHQRSVDGLVEPQHCAQTKQHEHRDIDQGTDTNRK